MTEMRQICETVWFSASLFAVLNNICSQCLSFITAGLLENRDLLYVMLTNRMISVEQEIRGHCKSCTFPSVFKDKWVEKYVFILHKRSTR